MSNRSIVFMDDTLLLRPHEIAVLEALAKDGADDKTVGRRVGLAPGTVNNKVAAMTSAVGVSRLELVVGFIRGYIKVRPE